jgi:8-oxo-dGTP pyrophosphatase MutT (NUDIX family)/CYTH domain-containing protein
MKPRKSERVYLVEGPLPELKGSSQSSIKLGCLAHDRLREVWVRQESRSFQLCIIKSPLNECSQECFPIPQQTFESLWRQTEAHRVELTRSILPHGDTSIQFDRFHGEFEPLITARITFETATSHGKFRKPTYLGQEIVPVESHDLRQIALHGLPLAGDSHVQAGAVPFLFKKGILHIVLITSSSGERWLIPKGHLESGMTLEEVALMEAAEEAGAIGTIEPGCRTMFQTEDGRTLRLFPLRVATLLPHWPERFARRRVVLPVYRALLRISDPGLAKALRDLSRRLTH